MNPLRLPVVRVALGIAIVLSPPLVGTLVGGVDWSAADFVLAGVMLAAIGAVVELAVRRAGNRKTAAGVGALGVLAGLLGSADDAPGLVLLGLLLLASACALGVRAVRR